MEGDSSFSQLYLCIQPPLQSPPEICSCFNFQLTILILIVQNIIFTIPTKAPFLYTSAIFHLAIFAYNHLNNLHPKYFFYLIHLDNSGCVKGPGSQEILSGVTLFNLAFLPQSMKYEITGESQSLIHYSSASENWCITRSS